MREDTRGFRFGVTARCALASVGSVVQSSQGAALLAAAEYQRDIHIQGCLQIWIGSHAVLTVTPAPVEPWQRSSSISEAEITVTLLASHKVTAF